MDRLTTLHRWTGFGLLWMLLGHVVFVVFGYANLLVCDGAAIPANPGVNPSLTIAALAEHAMSHVPAKAEPASPSGRATLAA